MTARPHVDSQVETHEARPSAPVFMARAFRARRARGEPDFMRIAQRWTGFRITPLDLDAFERGTGLGHRRGISILFPHAATFRLQMALLTHPSWPIPIWGALQIRNRLTLRRTLQAGIAYDLVTQAVGQRRVATGMEVDVHTRLARHGETRWESVVTYLYRGSFRGALAEPPVPAPEVPAAHVERLRLPREGKLAFARLTGDYNGIHLVDAYARRFGFRGAFAHPQRVAGQCLSRLAAPDPEGQSLALWIKGPGLYGAEAELRWERQDGSLRFALVLAHDPRPALVGRWDAAP